jgi:hypothetical protein
MKFLLIMHLNPLILDALTEDERTEVGKGHGEFIEAIQASGEMLGAAALADPAASAVVRVREGVPTVSDGPYIEAKEYLGGTKGLPFPATRTAAQGAEIAVRLATIGPGGPTGGFFDDDGPVPW